MFTTLNEGTTVQFGRIFNTTKINMKCMGYIETRNITEGDEYPQLVPVNIYMYEKFKGP